jgi:uncharacterized protein (TIGR02231 family)
MQIRYWVAGLVLAGAAVAQPPVAVKSEVGHVTVYADRARVEREAALPLVAGRQEFVFAGLPGWIDEESVRLALQPAGAGKIVDVRVAREHLTHSSDEEVRKAEAAVQETTDALSDIEDDLKVLAAQAKQVENVRAFADTNLPKEVAIKGVDVNGYGAVVKFVSDSLRDTASARRALERKQRDLKPEQAARQKKLGDLRQRNQLEQSTITVTVEAPQAQAAKVALIYMLPGCTWEAAHELRTSGEHPTSAQLTTFAVVSQTTGEDWNGAQLTFSTQSPSETLELPELQSLLLGQLPMPVAAKSSGSSFGKAQQLFEMQNNSFFGVNNGALQLDLYNDNFDRQNKMRERVLTVFQKLQKRGTTVHFEGQGRPVVRQDGRAVRIPLSALTLAAAEKIMCAPEKNPNAIHALTMTNTSKLPLLPGRVAIYQDEAFLGHTDVDFVADNETFALVLGVADGVKVRRLLDRRASTLTRGERTRMEVAFDITVENLYKAAVDVDLMDRVPVSQSKDIRVYRVRVEPDGKPDDRGLLQWKLHLNPGEKKSYRLEYSLEYPGQILLRARQNMDTNGLPAAAPAEDLIRKLEATF